MSSKPGGLILAGGQSRRMGKDKAGLPFGSETLLARAIRHMAPVAGPLVVSLAPGQVADPALVRVGALAVRDTAPFGGPLPGLLQGFRALAALELAPETVLVMPVDMPFYTGAWMERALAGLHGHAACLYRYEGFVNALVGAYRLSLLPKLEGLVDQPHARPMGLSQGEPTLILEIESLWRTEDGPPPLMDTDTPEDYAAALQLEAIHAEGRGADSA